MMTDPLLDPAELNALLEAGRAVVVDCRFDFSDPEKGRNDWLAAHVPGAFYADLDRDLAAPVTPASGRHPLPENREFARFLSAIGWTPEKVLVAYDAGNSMLAARLWWQMRYLGFDARVLDGGLAAWKGAGLPMESGQPVTQPSTVPMLKGHRAMRVSTDQVEASLEDGDLLLLDARAADRFRGENETLDPVAGHIPGAVSYPFAHNLELDGRFKPAAELRRQFESVLAGAESSSVVHTCGSGVSACHNLLAMEAAGLGGSRLYVGSWSQWIRDPNRAVETG
jgi:thiosulfate/3-mercaptopyruvate sulfurtransferase